MCVDGCNNPGVLLVDVDFQGKTFIRTVTRTDEQGVEHTDEIPDVIPSQRLVYCVVHGSALGLMEPITLAIAVPSGKGHPFPNTDHAHAEYDWALKES